MKRLAILLLVINSCSRPSTGVPDEQWLEHALTGLPPQCGWEIHDDSGASSSDSSCKHLRIILKEKSYGQAMQELQGLINQRLNSSGFRATGSSQACAGSDLTGFSFAVQTQDSIGTVAVSSARIDSSSIIVAIATSQLLKPKK
jgi:hypothetical protein